MEINRLSQIQKEILQKTNPSLEEKKMLEFISSKPSLEPIILRKIVIAYDNNQLEEIANYGIIFKPGGIVECRDCRRTLKSGFVCKETSCPHLSKENG